MFPKIGYVFLKATRNNYLSTPRLLMPWVLAMPGHQQPLYHRWKTNRSLSSIRKDFNKISVPKNDKKCIYHYVSSNKQGKSEGFDSCDRPSNLKLDSNRQFFRPCDREIWRMTLQYNRAPLLCYFKLCASFCSHWWIKTSITVRKRPIGWN